MASDITIIQTIITLAKSLEINLIAEGVETKRHADFLIRHDLSNCAR